MSETCRKPSFSFSMRPSIVFERDGKTIELVARAADRQALREIAGHDLLAGIRHAVDALQGVAADAEPDDDGPEAHDRERDHQRLAHQPAEGFRLAEVAADQQPQAVVEHENVGDRRMPRLRPLSA